MIPYLLPILGGVAITGFAGTAIGRYVQESSEEKLEWLDNTLKGLNGNSDFKYGVAVKLEDSSNSISCDDDWKKKTSIGEKTESCQRIKESWEKIQKKLYDNSNNGEWSLIYQDVKNLDHNNKHCNIFNWSPVQIDNDVGLKEAIKVLLELKCFRLEEESKAEKFKEFLEKVTTININLEQEDKLIGGILSGNLKERISGWGENQKEVSSPLKSWENVVKHIKSEEQNTGRLILKSKPNSGKGWALIEFKKS